MSERERWVVYPLLFLALGAALRDKLIDRTTSKTIKCQELVIEEEPTSRHAGRVLAKIGRTEATANAPAIGYFYVNGELQVDGVVKVDGVLNAKQYAYQGVLLPIWQPIPGFVVPNVLPPAQPRGQLKPPADEPKREETRQAPPAPDRTPPTT
jgi:hypothetical protein